jgi:RNA polymerase sigma factor (TIGR02999 family)
MPRDAMPTTGEVTRLLALFSQGRKEAGEQLIPLVYAELKKVAASCMRGELPGGTLQPTALVHEAWVRLAGQRETEWQNRSHFYGVAASLMRRILLDYARKRHAAKRGSGARKFTLDRIQIPVEDRIAELIVIDECLERLARFDADQARIVELRFFAGLTVEEIAVVTESSPSSVKRELNSAKAWLYRELGGQKGQGNVSRTMAAD